MYFQISDVRTPLKAGDIVEYTSGSRIVIDRYLGCGGFSLMYLAHVEGCTRYLALKELFPRQLENMVIQRADNGKIVICDPATGDIVQDDDPLWQELRQYLKREAELTQKAGAVYDWSGRQTAQNNPDILHAEGPFLDRLGNTYLSIDTYQGEPLRDLIERGFLRDESGNVLANHFMAEILDVLTETAVRLSALHAAGLWHLDLSPDNIYVVPSAGKTRLTPYIIDFGSSYDCNNKLDIANHRYTYNPFSPPEILALAQLNANDCGYSVDASSDTYALASILFYAATGKIFTAEHRMNSAQWEEAIRREYAGGLPAHHGADTFAGNLIAFFDKALSASQQDRLRTTKALHDAFKLLRTQYAQYGNLLPLIKQDELMSYMVLEKHPLYLYRGDDGNFHVLCLGSGVFVHRMILSLISCGQMAGSKLFIHIVSDEPEENLKKHLHTAAPMLEHYSNPKAEKDCEYVTFSYDRVSSVLDKTVCCDVLERYPDCRYILVSLGSNSSNIEAAQLYATQLAQIPNPSAKQTVINYYCSEDAANNICSFLDQQSLPKWLEVEAFGNNLSAYSKVIRTLGLRTLRVAHLYNKLDNPCISLAETAQQLTSDEYSQRSSCAAALHLKYKLASMGINPAPTTTRKSIIGAYQKYLSGKQYGILVELEHRRWMMYMIADGYQKPSPTQLDCYGFEYVDDHFNNAWKCKIKRLHPCLVPCGTGNSRLTNEDWNNCSTLKKIKESKFDPLDQVSLTLHLMAGKKCRDILEYRTIHECFRRISLRLNSVQADAEADPECDAAKIPFQALKNALNKVRENICRDAETLNYTGDHGQFSELSSLFGNWGMDISGLITSLRNILSVFIEYTARKDYKRPDETLIRHLLWLLYADNDITCIKLRGRTISDNISAPLILEPHRLIYFGTERHDEWNEFLRSHGNRGEILYLPYCGDTLDQITSRLKRIAAQQQSGCVIDITGADEKMVIAAQRVADANSSISLIRCTTDGCVENIQNFTAAPAYTLNTTIAAEEIFSLHGAHRHPSGLQYMEQLEDRVPALWTFFQEFRSEWNEITAFFAGRGSGTSELYLNNLKIDSSTVWVSYHHTIDKVKWDMLELAPIFEKLNSDGIIQELDIDEYYPGKLDVYFMYPTTEEGTGSSRIKNSLDNFFGKRILSIFTPMRCAIKGNKQNLSIDIHSGWRVDIYDQRNVDFPDFRYQNTNSRIPYARIIPALKRLEELRLIADLTVSRDPTQLPVEIRFLYVNPALQTCLATAGNILELYIWMEAKKTRFFDNVQSNLAFVWKEGIDNELDVIMTKGLHSLIVSAKTSRFNREHLYEIKYLTEHFSLNSKPVIVYSPDRSTMRENAIDEMHAVKRRAQAMGVYLIDLQDNGPSLGDRLTAIADGTAPL